jgi:hypothetical protein
VTDRKPDQTRETLTLLAAVIFLFCLTKTEASGTNERGSLTQRFHFSLHRSGIKDIKKIPFKNKEAK